MSSQLADASVTWHFNANEQGPIESRSREIQAYQAHDVLYKSIVRDTTLSRDSRYTSKVAQKVEARAEQKYVNLAKCM
jgi:hypothetical protein